MTDQAQVVVDALHRAMGLLQQDKSVAPEFKEAVSPGWAERRIRDLETQIGDLVTLYWSGIVLIGGEDGPKFVRMLNEMAEDAGYDKDEYDREGFDRSDI